MAAGVPAEYSHPMDHSKMCQPAHQVLATGVGVLLPAAVISVWYLWCMI